MSGGQGFVVSLLLAWYRLVLRLYPRRFREEFGQEMAGVYARVLAGAAGRGPGAIAGVWLRESLTLPANLAGAYLDAWDTFVLGNKGGSGQPGLNFILGWTMTSGLAPGFGFLLSFPFSPLLTALFGEWTARYGKLTPTEDALLLFILFPMTGLVVGSVQALMLRPYLQHARYWLLSVVAGFAGLLLVNELWLALPGLSGSPFGQLNQYSLLLVAPVAATSGGLQWLFLRKQIPGACWLPVTAVLAAPFIVLPGNLFTLTLAPSVASGLTVLLLLRRHDTRSAQPVSPAG